MRNVYHHFEDPAAMNASMAAALKPGARLAVVDFSPPPGSEAKTPADRSKDGTHGVTSEALARELKDAGFEPVSSELGAERWFMVVVSKAKREQVERRWRARESRERVENLYRAGRVPVNLNFCARNPACASFPVAGSFTVGPAASATKMLPEGSTDRLCGRPS